MSGGDYAGKWGLLDAGWRGRVFVGSVVVDGGGGAGWGDAAGARGEDELGGGVGGGFAEEHVAAGAAEEGGEDGGGLGGAVVAEDALVGDAAGDGDADEVGDGAENLVEAGVFGVDVDEAGGVGDYGAVGAVVGGCVRCGGDGGELVCGRWQRCGWVCG